MADKEQTKKTEKKSEKVVIERVYTIPLRRDYLKVPLFKRAKKAIRAIREFLIQHMKSDDPKIDNSVNLAIWKHGIKNPPHHIKVTVVKYDDGNVVASYAGDDFKLLNRLKKLQDRDKAFVTKKTAPKKETKKAEAKTEELKTEYAKAHEHKEEAKPKAVKKVSDAPKSE